MIYNRERDLADLPVLAKGRTNLSDYVYRYAFSQLHGAHNALRRVCNRTINSA